MFAYATHALLSSASITAQVPETSIVVTGARSRAEETLVIDSSEIEALQPASLLDVLDELPGVRARSTGGLGGTSFLSIRGGEPNFTLVLIDGIRVNNPTGSEGGGFDFAQLDPASVERVEVVPNMASAIHGSDALSGVINVSLREPPTAGLRASGRLAGDSRGGAAASATLAAGGEAGGLLVGGSWYDSGDVLGAELRRLQGFARARLDLGDFEGRMLLLRGSSTRSGYPQASGGPIYAATDDRERRESNLTLAGATLLWSGSERLRPRLSISWSAETQDLISPEIPPGMLQPVPAIESRTRFERLQTTFDLLFRASSHLALAAGADFIDENGRSSGFIDFGFPLPTGFRLRRDSIGVFAEGTWTPAQVVELLAAIRSDWHADERETSVRFSARLRPRGAYPLFFANFSTGYKLPSIYALVHPLIGNPSLRPERSRGWEAGVEHRLGGRFSGRFAIYRTVYRDLVDFDVESFTSVNRLRVTATGFDAVVTADLRRNLRAEVGLGHVDLDSETPLRLRPAWEGSFRLKWDVSDRVAIGGSLSFTSSFLDASVPTGQIRLQGGAEFGADARLRLSPNTDLAVSVRNGFNARLQDAVGFRTDPRSVRASISTHF